MLDLFVLGSRQRYALILCAGVLLIVLAFLLRPASGDEDSCEALAARALAASTPGPRSALAATPPTEQEMNRLVQCLEERRQ